MSKTRWDTGAVQAILAKSGIKNYEIYGEENPGPIVTIRTRPMMKQETLNELFRATGLGWQNIPLILPDEGVSLKAEMKAEVKEETKAAPATKHDRGKPQMGLISSTFLKGLAQVLTFGAGKYSAHNWRKGFALSRPYDALQRHLVAWNEGHDTDEESGLPTLYHAACELMFLTELAETRPELDDRFKGVHRAGSQKYQAAQVQAFKSPTKGEWVYVELDGKNVAAFVPEKIEGDQLPLQVYFE